VTDPVLPGRYAVFLLECPVKGGIIRKTHGFGNGFQGLIPFNQTFGRDEAALGDAAVEAEPQLVPKNLGVGTLADL